MAREELKWQNIDADDLPAEVKKSFDAMVEAEATFKADLEKLLKHEGQSGAHSGRGRSYGRSIGLLPDRRMLFTPTAGVPDFSAMIRSCSSMTARAAASPSRPPRTSLGTLRLERCEPSS